MNFRMFKKAFVAAFALAFCLSAAAFAKETTYNLDAAHSSAGFKIRHLGISWVRGTFADLSGVIVYDPDDLSKSSVEVVVKTASVDTNNDKRDDHLRTADFFDVEKYPEMTFKSKKVKGGGEDGKIKVEGEFTLHGVTKTITVEVELAGEGQDNKGINRISFESEFSFNRGDYGMKGSIPAVGDAVRAYISVEAIEAKPDDGAK